MATPTFFCGRCHNHYKRDAERRFPAPLSTGRGHLKTMLLTLIQPGR